MLRYKILVFDLDGTLVDSLTDLADSANKGLEAAGLPTHPYSDYRRFVGNGVEVLIDRAMGEMRNSPQLRALVKETFNREYSSHCNDNTAPYPGCTQLLSKLRENKIMTAVFSNKPDEYVGRILKKVYPEHIFDVARGKLPGVPKKPDGTGLRAILSHLGISRGDCLYIGDSDVDVFTAKNAGVDMLGVEWGFRGRQELLSAGADIVVKTTDELLEHIGL